MKSFTVQPKKGMRNLSSWQTPEVFQIGLVVLAGLLSITAGISNLVFSSPISPLIVVGVVIAILAVLICIRRPVLAMYMATLVVLLPYGLIPVNLASNLNRVLTVGALILWGVYVIVRRHRILWTRAALFMLCFLVWGLLTFFWAGNLETAKNALGGYALRMILYLFLIANEVYDQKTFEGLMRTMAVAGWVYMAAGVISLITNGYQTGTRMQILAENENSIGSLFSVVVVGVIWLAIRKPNPHRFVWVFLSLAFILLSLVLVALSGSRGSAISWFITMLVLLFWRKTRLWGIVALLVLVVALISVPLVFSTTIDRFLGTSSESLLGGRESLWQAGWLLISDHPLTGVGVGNSPNAMIPYILMFSKTGGVYDRAPIHNPILAVWADTGLPGVLLYLGVLVSSIGSFIRQYLRNRSQGGNEFTPYFALAAAAFLGYFASWIKGGGMELGHSYFLMLALLMIPSHLVLDHSTA